jgi:hypothetical protein
MKWQNDDLITVGKKGFFTDFIMNSDLHLRVKQPWNCWFNLRLLSGSLKKKTVIILCKLVSSA